MSHMCCVWLQRECTNKKKLKRKKTQKVFIQYMKCGLSGIKPDATIWQLFF